MTNKKMVGSFAAAIAVATISASSTETTVAAPADQYLCVADTAAGFTFNKSTKEWTSTTFRTDNKWLIKKSKTGPNMAVARVGDQYSTFQCDTHDPRVTYLKCPGIGDFFINYSNGRYEARGPHVYSIAGDFFVEGENDLWIEIGKCSPL